MPQQCSSPTNRALRRCPRRPVELEALDPNDLYDLLTARIGPLLDAELIAAELQTENVEREALRRLA